MVGKDYYPKKVTNDDTNIPSTSFGLSSDDTVGGIIWAERQIAIGIKGGNSVIDVKPKALLDISGNVDRVPSIIINTNSNINSATDSVIISNNNSKNIGGYLGNENNTAKSSIIIGDNNVWASDKSIILGTDNTIGVDSVSISNCANNIIVLGQNNTAINEINTCIIGGGNIVDSSGNTNSKGNLIFGTSNTYYSKSVNKNENNLIIGDQVSLIDSEYSIISGNNNDTSGKHNLVIGKENKIGFGDEITTQTTQEQANNSYILGNTNKIKANNSTAVTNTYMLGTNNECDATDSSFIDNVDSSTIIFGSYGKINWTSDVSNQRFIFSTQEKHVADGGGTNNGHVFTIDKLGNTVIEGDLTVRGNKSITDLCGNDASFNNVFILQDLSGNDASFNNLRILQDLSGNDASFNNLRILQDLSGNDASFNNLRVLQDLSGNDASFNNLRILQDLSGNDASFNNLRILQDLSGNDASFNNLRILQDLSGNDASFNNLRILQDLSGNDASFNEIVIKNTLKTNTIQNDTDDHITISNTTSNKDIVFNTKSGTTTTTEAMRLVANGTKLNFYGGYEDTGVTIDEGGNLKMNGKLTVDGIIDPTGLVLTKQSSNPNSSDSSTDHLTLFFDENSGGLQYVTRDGEGNEVSKVIATGSSGGSGGGTAIEGNAETASNLKKGTNGVLYQTGGEVTSILAYGSSNGKFLKSNGSAPTWSDLPTATTNVVGGIKIGYSNTDDDKNYAVQLSEGNAYVNVPWEDTIYELPTNNVTNASVSDNTLTLTKKGVTDDITFTNTDTVYELPTNNVTNASVSDNTLTLTKKGVTDDITFTNTDTVYELPTNNVTNASVSDNTLTLTKKGVTDDITFTNTDTVYELPTNNVTNASVSDNTLTLTRKGVTDDITFTNTDTVYELPTNNVTNASVSDNTLTLTRKGVTDDITFTNIEYTAGTGITISDNAISLSDPGQTAKGVTIVDTGGTERTLDFRNGLLVSGLANGTTTGDIIFEGTTLKFTNGFLTTQTTVSGN